MQSTIRVVLLSVLLFSISSALPTTYSSVSSDKPSNPDITLHVSQGSCNTQDISSNSANVVYERASDLSSTLCDTLKLMTGKGTCFNHSLPWCVVPERSPYTVTDCQVITEDLYMLTNLTTYLQITVEYEENRYHSNLTQQLKTVQRMLQELIVALANMTDIDVQEILPQTFYYSGSDSSSTEDTTSGVSGVTNTGESSSVSDDRCSGSISPKFQYENVYELYIAVLYVWNDLRAIKDHLPHQ